MSNTSFSKRAAQTIFDSLMQLSILCISMSPLYITSIYMQIYPDAISYLVFGLVIIFSVILTLIMILLYAVYLPFKMHGATLGMRLFKTKFLTFDNHEVSLQVIFTRFALRLIFIFLSFGISLIVDFIIILGSEKHLSFYDYLTNSKIVDI